MGTRDWLGVTAGALLAVVGLGAWLGAGDLPAPAPEPAVVATTTQHAPAVEAAMTEEVPAAEPVADRVDDLPPSVARVLEAWGNLGVLSGEEVSIPESVRRVLIAHEAVLTVAEPAAR